MEKREMECPDLDGWFKTYMKRWMQKNADRLHDKADEVEDLLPDLYLKFLKLPIPALGGISPEAYFARFDDAVYLVRWMQEYQRRNIAVPDLLMERIVSLGDDSERELLKLLDQEDLPKETRTAAVSLLREMDSTAPMNKYIDTIAAAKTADEICELYADALLSMGEAIRQPVLENLESATPAGQEIFIDLLVNYPGDERIYQLAVRLFRQTKEKKALFASCLGKLGDPRAIGVLKSAAADPDLNYLDYTEIADCIEALGGDRPEEREFSGDPYYESLSAIRENESDQETK